MERIERARHFCQKDFFSRWKVRVGITLTTIGIFVAALNGIIIDSILQSNMALSPKSMSYPMWKDLPEPLINSIYLFNVTNAEDVYKNGAKPKLQEVGPYVFHEYHHKFDEIWNGNNTVTYKQRNKWIPVKGNLDDKVTILNIPIASMGAMVEHLPSATKKMINMGLGFSGQ